MSILIKTSWKTFYVGTYYLTYQIVLGYLFMKFFLDTEVSIYIFVRQTGHDSSLFVRFNFLDRLVGVGQRPLLPTGGDRDTEGPRIKLDRRLCLPLGFLLSWKLSVSYST